MQAFAQRAFTGVGRRNATASHRGRAGLVLLSGWLLPAAICAYLPSEAQECFLPGKFHQLFTLLF